MNDNQVNKGYLDRKQNTCLIWENLSYSIPVCESDKLYSKNSTDKTIINSVTGWTKGGECLAVMGGSGAGKSTLMNLLSGKINENNEKCKILGSIELNGSKIDPKKLKEGQSNQG